MPKPAKGRRLGSGPDHERLMLAGLAAALFRDERIRTTETKARRLRPLAERLITLGKGGSVHHRRRALSVIEDREIVHKLFAEIAPRYAERNGGYTRILKLGPRKGDAAPMALIELIEGEAVGASAPAAAGRGRGRLLRRRRREAAAQAQESGRRGRERPESTPESSPEPAETMPEGSDDEGSTP
ncbi:MAG: 50S ribosomal protein L17 [Actinomycetota bacterium]